MYTVLGSSAQSKCDVVNDIYTMVFAGMIYKRVWNNLELHITNVHIRYEDLHSCPKPLAMGFCLHALSAHTTNQ